MAPPTGSARQRCDAFHRLQDQSSNRARLGHIDRVGLCGVWNHSRAGPGGHRALRGGRGSCGPPSRPDPARLALPRRHRDCAAEGLDAPWYLRVSHEGRLLGVHVRGERRVELGSARGGSRLVAGGWAARVRRAVDSSARTRQIHQHLVRTPRCRRAHARGDRCRPR